jgi:hypothetical protein
MTIEQNLKRLRLQTYEAKELKMNGTISPTDDIEILLEFFKDNTIYQRHHEDIRFKGSQLVITIAGALLAFLKFTSPGSSVNYVIAVFIVLLGILGIAQVLKHTERADRHATIARSIRAEIGQIALKYSATSITTIHRQAANAHKSSAGFAYKLRARWSWWGMHCAIMIIGVALIILNYFNKL